MVVQRLGLSDEFLGSEFRFGDDRDIFLEADKELISILINNAFKFTKKNGRTILVKVGKEKREGNEFGEGDNIQEVVVRVKDAGSGIDPEKFPRLFDKFVSKFFRGTGLGLFISKSIVEAHHGSVWAENNNNADAKKGATIYFILPILCKEQHSDNNMIVN